jgi:hypothetical protein
VNQLTFDGFLFYLFGGCVLLLAWSVIEFFWERWDNRK